MPYYIQVSCINKSDRFSPHERIRAVGGRSSSGTTWTLSQEEAIAGVESGKWTFWVSVGGRRVGVVVAVSAHGNKYLKTEADGEGPNNLLNLPECP
jgi:hypothetical protein